MCCTAIDGEGVCVVCVLAWVPGSGMQSRRKECMTLVRMSAPTLVVWTISVSLGVRDRNPTREMGVLMGWVNGLF